MFVTKKIFVALTSIVENKTTEMFCACGKWLMSRYDYKEFSKSDLWSKRNSSLLYKAEVIVLEQLMRLGIAYVLWRRKMSLESQMSLKSVNPPAPDCVGPSNSLNRLPWYPFQNRVESRLIFSYFPGRPLSVGWNCSLLRLGSVDYPNCCLSGSHLSLGLYQKVRSSEIANAFPLRA